MRQQLVLFMLWVYRRYLTRYTPACADRVKFGQESCSTYAVRVVHEYGATRGVELTLDKIKTCGRE